jgi:hypothetical protein
MPNTKIRIVQRREESGNRITAAGVTFSDVPFEFPMVDNSAISLLAWHATDATSTLNVVVQWGELLQGEYPHVPAASSDISIIWRDSSISTTFSNVTTQQNAAGRLVATLATTRTLLIPIWEAPFMRLKLTAGGTNAGMSVEAYVRMNLES